MINVSILGFGTVGSGVYQIINENNKELEASTGKKIRVKSILDSKKSINPEIADILAKDFEEIENDEEVSVVVETIGGTGAAYDFVKRSLLKGKNVVTSNKALVEMYGSELLRIAKEKDVSFLFEASVGGGIPVLRTIGDAFAGEVIKEIDGILNGTTNYILTCMTEDGQSFEEALLKAQELGYAERDPEADIEGHDTGRKIAILSSLACGKEVKFSDIYLEGISKIEKADLEYAKKMKMAIKLCGSATVDDNGDIAAYVCPMMLDRDNPLYMVKGVFNAILLEGNMIGRTMLYGSGAGKLPTASAVVSDILSIIKLGSNRLSIGWTEERAKVLPMEKTSHRYFVRLKDVDDKHVDRCRRAFADSEVIRLEGLDEFAILTGYIREKDFNLVSESLNDIIKFIRVR